MQTGARDCNGRVIKPTWLTKMSSLAKTVAFSPLRQGQVSVKNTLDNPFNLKWPDVSPKIVSQLLLEIERTLSGMKGCFARCQQQKSKQRTKLKRKGNKNKPSTPHSDSESQEPPRKKPCLTNAPLQMDTLNSNSHTNATNSTKNSFSKLPDLAISMMKSQLVIGVNNVTRCLERGELAAGCVCLSARPWLVTRHVMMLAATRSVPFVALPSLSPKVCEVLGDIKSALAIGIKKSTSDTFTSLIEAISKHAPPIVIPWLSPLEETLSPEVQDNTPQTIKQDKASNSSNVEECKAHNWSFASTKRDTDQSQRGNNSFYTPVQIKKSIVETKKRSKKK